MDSEVNPDAAGIRCYQILLPNRQKMGTNCHVGYVFRVLFVGSFPVWNEADLHG